MLSRMQLNGGAPRSVAADIVWGNATWAPDGKDLAVVRTVQRRNRLEYPIGKVLYETTNRIGVPRFSPGGDKIAFYESDGVTPLPDTDADGVPDTGTMATGGKVDVVVTVTVPGNVNPGDSERSLLTFSSSNDVTKSKTARAITTVPPPGVSIGPRAYLPLQPGDVAQVPMTARNTGGFPDTVELAASSHDGWTVTLLDAATLAPLQDSDGDGLVDTGVIPGLTATGIVAEIHVPANAPLEIVDRTDVTANSHADPRATAVSSVVIELLGPPSPEWPQFHHDRERSGVGPVPFELPLTQRWTAAEGGNPVRWTSPVIDRHTAYVTDADGNLLALDLGSGEIKWRDSLGSTGCPRFGYCVSGTPLVVYGNLYVTFVTGTGSTMTLFSIDPADGSVNWRVDDSFFPSFFFNGASSTPTAAAGTIYWTNDGSGKMLASNASTGAELWTYQLPDVAYQGPAYSAGMVFSGDGSGDLVGLDAFSGTVIWQARLNGAIVMAPTVSNGILYVGDTSGLMYAFDALSGATRWTSTQLGVLFDSSTPAIAEGKIFVATFDIFTGTMYALDEATGSVVWAYPLPAPVGSSPAYNNGTVFLSSWDGNLYAWDAGTGGLINTWLLAPVGSTSSVALADGYLVVGDESGKITGFSFVGAGEVSSVAPTPSTTTVSVTTGSLFHADAFDRYGNRVGGQSFSWDSQADLGTIVPISLSGDLMVYVAGATAGIDTLQVTGSGHSGTATVNIVPGALDHVDVLPGVASIVAGTTMTFTAQAKDRFGNTISGAGFTWGVSGGIGTIDSAGRFTASTTVGTGTVTAQSGPKTGTSIVEIAPAALEALEVTPSPITVAAGGTLLLNAAGLDRYGNEVSGLSVSWATTLGSVTPTGIGSPTAVLSGGFSAGSGTLSVASGGVSLTVAVTVTPGPANRIDVSPTPATVVAGGTLAFTGTPRDLFGNAISGLALSWSASSSLGTIASTGVLTAATAVGTGTVTVTAGSAAATVSVTIVPAAPARIVVSPTSLSVPAGSTSTLVASLQDTNGNVISAGTLSWSGGLPLSSDGRIVQYSAPTTTGTDTLTVSQGGVSSTVDVTIVAGPASAVAISGSASVAAGATTTFTASLTDAYGNVVSGATVSWSASRGTITAAGVLTAPTEAGSVVVIASAAGRQASLTVDVTAAALDHLAPSATTINLLTGGGTLLTVSGVDAYGNDVSGVTYTWSTTIGSVTPAANGNSASFAAGDSGGSGTITISAGGKTATVAVSVAESSLPIARQATTTTSLVFLIVAILAIAASILMLGRARAARRELDEMRKGGAPPPP